MPDFLTPMLDVQEKMSARDRHERTETFEKVFHLWRCRNPDCGLHKVYADLPRGELAYMICENAPADDSSFMAVEFMPRDERRELLALAVARADGVLEWARTRRGCPGAAHKEVLKAFRDFLLVMLTVARVSARADPDNPALLAAYTATFAKAGEVAALFGLEMPSAKVKDRFGD